MRKFPQNQVGLQETCSTFEISQFLCGTQCNLGFAQMRFQSVEVREERHFSISHRGCFSRHLHKYQSELYKAVFDKYSGIWGLATYWSPEKMKPQNPLLVPAKVAMLAGPLRIIIIIIIIIKISHRQWRRRALISSARFPFIMPTGILLQPGAACVAQSTPLGF